MIKRTLAVLMVIAALPLAACSAGPATAARPWNPYACQYFRSWFSYVRGDVASHRSGADSVLAAAVTMSFSGQLHSDLTMVRSYADRIRRAKSASTLGPTGH
jgi:hypothetical protein